MMSRIFGSNASRSSPAAETIDRIPGAAGAVALAVILLGCQRSAVSTLPSSGRSGVAEGATVLPTGVHLDPVAASISLGSMPLAMTFSPDGTRVIAVLSGKRQQGFQVVERSSGRVLQTVVQRSAFIGSAFSPDGRTLYVSGGNQDVVYRYAWHDGAATLVDSLTLARKPSGRNGTRYPAGIATSPDGRWLYVAENMADSVAVLDVTTGAVIQRLATERYPYAVAVAHDGTVYASAWGGHTVSILEPTGDGRLREVARVPVVRHPSGIVLNANGSRLFVASGSTDRVAVVDTRTRSVIATLHDAPPAGPGEGSTPNALALSANGTRLFVAEADNNAVAVFDLAAATSGVATARGSDAIAGRIPADWYPTAVLVSNDTLLVLSGKGHGTAPNPGGPTPLRRLGEESRDYTLGQTTGSLMTTSLANATSATLGPLSHRVAVAQGWSDFAVRRAASPMRYPPFTHIIYVIKENRTYDEVLGDLSIGDGDSSLVFFPRAVSPNHHALAERFGDFDRFFTNAEVSADGHNWSTAAYASDYVEKTVPSNYSGRGRTYDYEGTNRGFGAADVPDDDVNEPGRGYLWDAADRANVSLRNYGEFVVRDNRSGNSVYRGDKPFLATHTNPDYPGFDLDIRDSARMDVWMNEFADHVRTGFMPQLEILRLPNDHTSGASAGKPTPRVYMADNDRALGRMVEALSRSPFWRNTVIFVLEDDAQNGPDHVDSHRSPVLVISAYSPRGVVHRWTNTSDIIATIGEILHLGPLSQFDFYGRPLRDIWTASPDLTPYAALTPAVDMSEKNPAKGIGASASARLDLSSEDRADESSFNRILWRAIKGSRVPYPGISRVPAAEWRTAR